MILHVCTLDKFIPPFIELINNNFCQKDHWFLVYGDKDKFPFNNHPNIEYQPYFANLRKSWITGLKNICRFNKLACKSEKIILHGLFDNSIVKFLAMQPSLLNKCYWVMWGADLYHFEFRNKTFSSNLHELFRRIVIKRLGHFVTQIVGDYQLACKWYKASGKYHECFMYTSNLYKERPSNHPPKSSSTINILVGNSADPSNNHIEVFNKLFPLRDRNTNIFVPLSYGNQEYAKHVITVGRAMFGNNFFPLTEFLNADQYADFLANIDFAIFNHKRQQAMGNTITLLGMKAPVFLRKSTSTWKSLIALGFTIYDIGSFSMQRPNKYDLDSNALIAMKVFNKDNLLRQLRQIFDSRAKF